MSNVENSQKRKYIKLSDIFVVLMVIAVAVSVILCFSLKDKGQELVAVIRVDGEVYSEIKLSEVSAPYEVSVVTEDGVVTVHISGDGACVVSSPCPDELCVNTGKITKQGQSVVCLPERVSVQLLASESETTSLDAVAG